MRNDIKSKVSRYYGEKISTFGAVPQGVDWKDEYSQNIRFEQLLKILPGRKEVTLNDLGCGYGAIYLYKNLAKRLRHYYGYDISEDMLAGARNLIKDCKAEFIKSDRITKEVYYSIASGLFNVKLDADIKTWEEFILETLSNMNEISSKEFAFNCLTSYVDYKVDHLYYADPLYYFDYCKKNLSKRVALLHDYDLYEWTMLIKK
jgi:SAM-dependent methyltransferase